MEKEKQPISSQAFERNVLDLISQEPGTFMTTPEDYLPDPNNPRPIGIYLKDFPELRRLAIPIARFLLEHGLLMGRVVIQTDRVDVYTDEAGMSFTDAEQDEIFQGLADKA